jgi:hypothetical protein
VLVKNNHYNMKYLKSMNENISKLKTYHVGGFSPELKLMEKINELIDVIEKLEKRVKELESK